LAKVESSKACLVDSFIADTNGTATNLVHTFALTLIFGSHIYPFGYGVGVAKVRLWENKVNFGEDKGMKKEISKGRSVGNNNSVDRMIAAKRAWSLCKSKKAAFVTWPTLCRLENPFHQIPCSKPN